MYRQGRKAIFETKLKLLTDLLPSILRGTLGLRVNWFLSLPLSVRPEQLRSLLQRVSRPGCQGLVARNKLLGLVIMKYKEILHNIRPLDHE